MAGKKPYDYLHKIILIGNSKVGKSGILYRYKEGYFLPIYIATIGIDYMLKTIELEGKKIKLLIWEISGQERFRTITCKYYRGRSGIILVYDITNYKSFEDIKRVWLPMVEEYADADVLCLLIGNKSDSAEEERQVPIEKGIELAQQLSIPFWETSAKTNHNISEAFMQIARNILVNQLAKEALLQEERKINQQLLEDALANQGYVLMQILKILVMGVAGAGKTSVKNQIVLGLHPSRRVRNSTMLLEAPIRAISQTIAKIECDDDTDTKWSIVNSDELLSMIASALKAQGIIIEADEVAIPTQSPSDKASPTADKTKPDDATSEPSVTTSEPTSAASDSLLGTAESTSDDEPLLAHVSGSQLVQKMHSSSKYHLVKLLEQSQASNKLMQVQWVHFIDTGGQPQFRELLPSVVHSMSMIMHVLRLSESFDKYPQIDFYEEGKPCCKPVISAYTNEQILQQTLQSIQVQSSLMPGEHATTADRGMETKARQPKLVVVGTHRDLESECSETRAQKNTRIRKLLSPFINDVVFCNGLEEAIFAMNAIDPSDDDNKVINKIRTEVANLSKFCRQHKVPISWFLLEQDIHQFAGNYGRGVVSLEECLAIARSLSINYEALKAALSYFHQLNVFLYYPSLLPDVVFCDPQVPLTIISVLVFFNYYLRSIDVTASDSEPLLTASEPLLTTTTCESQLTTPESSTAESSTAESSTDESTNNSSLSPTASFESFGSDRSGSSGSDYQLGQDQASDGPKQTLWEHVVDTNLEDVLDGRWFRFRDEGILTVEMLEHKRFRKLFVPGLFSPVELIQLLQYLSIAAPLSSSKVGSSNALSSSDEFFLPCLLPTLSPAEICQRSQSLPPDSPHLLLAFPSGCVPSGIFSNVIVCLRSLHNWKIYPTCVFSNYIEFHLPDVPLTVTLIDSFNYIEVQVQVLISSSSALQYEHVFPQIRLAIIESIEGAASRLKFVKCIPVAMFLCEESSNRCSSNPHAAEILGGDCWRCTENPRICEPLSKEQLLWLKDPTGYTKHTCTPFPPAIHDTSAGDVLDAQHLLEITDYIQDLEKTDLYNLGLVFGLRRHRITDLRERCSCLEFCDSVVDCWLQKVDDVETRNMVPSWRNLVLALKHCRVGQTGLAGHIAKERQVFF